MGLFKEKADVFKLKAICMMQSNVRGMFVRTIIGLWLERYFRSSIIIQSTYRMHKIRSQHKKIILSIIYMQSFVRRIVAQNEYELKVNAALLLQEIWRMIEKRKDYTQIIAHTMILQKRWRRYSRLSNYNSFKSSIIILQTIGRGSIVRTIELNETKLWL